MNKIITVLLLSIVFTSHSQKKIKEIRQVERPKLIIGIVVDQMRWDYLYRYYNCFSKGGFKRLMEEGFNCENTFVPYTPTVTAAGHTCIYTGSIPGIHGIVGNNWWNKSNEWVYCTDDKNVQSVGTSNNAGQMSPRNMLTTNICDELRLASNFKSKVVGIALKDRGAILPAGHSANAAYWYDPASGNFISSTYYMNDLPQWVKTFNSRTLPDSLMNLGWNTFYPINTYEQSSTDEKVYEGRYKGFTNTSFPYRFDTIGIRKRDLIRSTPYGNTLTAEFAKAVLLNEQLGKGNNTDFLTVSFSSTDYIGHQFGPNSIENEDDYIRFDKELENFLSFLDKEIGKGKYTLFLTADHAAAHVPGFLKENKLPAGNFDPVSTTKDLNLFLKNKTGYDSLIEGIVNAQVYINESLVKEEKLEEDKIKECVIAYMMQQESISKAIDIRFLSMYPLNDRIKSMMVNGYYAGRSGHIQLVFKPGYIDHEGTGTTHGSWNPYDSHIPLLLMGWGVKPGKTNREIYMTDIAPTIAALLHIQMPNGSIGKVIEEVIKGNN